MNISNMLIPNIIALYNKTHKLKWSMSMEKASLKQLTKRIFFHI